MTTHFADIRRNALQLWKTRSKRVFKVTDNFDRSIECEWQDAAYSNGYNHISIFCSLGSFVSHLTDLLRDYRYDKYEFDQSDNVNETLFRYYSRILLITSEVLTDFQDLFILAENKLTTKGLRRLTGQILRQHQDNARHALSNNSNRIAEMLDYINKICKHKTANLHICNHHIKYLFQDFHKNIQHTKNRIEFHNINNYTSYDEATFKKNSNAEFLVIPSLHYIIEVILDGYTVIDNLFRTDPTKIEFICEHFEEK